MKAGEFIKEARLKKNLTQKEVGKACGYDERWGEIYVSGWERGIRSIPIGCAIPLSELLGIPLDQLIKVIAEGKK